MNAPAAFRPAYLALLDSGELERRVESAYRHLEDCDLCARYESPSDSLQTPQIMRALSCG
jgi:hypothetical protein